MMLITLAEARAQIRSDDNYDDAYLLMSIRAASSAIMNYLAPASRWIDSTGEIPVDSDGILQGLPDEVHWACMLLVGEFYKNREGEQDGEIGGVLGIPHGYGYLPRPVVALLFPYREFPIA